MSARRVLPRLLAALAAAVAAAVAAAPAHANDGVYGGSGTHPMPLTTSEVRMVEEHVVLRWDEKASAWETTCDFTFENTADAPVTLTIGFPFPKRDEEEGGDVSTPKGRKAPKPGEPIVWDFKTTVRGKPVAAKQTRTLTNPELPLLDYQVAYVWDVTFAPKERVAIRNTYRHGLNAMADGTFQAAYVLRTGGLWKGGRIGRSRLEVQVPSARFALCPKDKPDEGWEWVEAVIQPAGGVARDTPDGGITVSWDLKDFRPESDLTVCFVDLDSLAPRRFYELAETPLAGKSAAELRILRNTVYAWHGYVFKSDDLRAHFAKQWWYRPDPAYTPKRLSRDEHAFIAKVKALEDKAGGGR